MSRDRSHEGSAGRAAGVHREWTRDELAGVAATMGMRLVRKRPKRERENPEIAAMIRSMLRAYSKRAGAGDLDAMADMAKLAAEIEGHLIDVVAKLRHEPYSYSWAEIGRALGIGRTAAQKRFGKVGGTRRPGGQPGDLR